jgi:hypothetical protein
VLGGGYLGFGASRCRSRRKHGGYGDQGRKAKIGHPSAIDHQKLQFQSTTRKARVALDADYGRIGRKVPGVAIT